ncbi:MAG: hypothetical protein FJY79_04220 [Candidatus Aminicenantes bacterium]|nr:hypothetical protein [Candidatus Aminicenantes bacterium]
MAMKSNGRFRGGAWRALTRLALPFAFLFLFAPLSSPAADIPYSWTGVERTVAVGDLHGDYDRFVFILTHPEVAVADSDLRWAAGKTHLVQLGDVLDRGPDAKKIFDLLMRLEKEAETAGGMLHFLIGNHEEMNITGIALDYPQYITPEQFVSFLPDDVRKVREKAYIASLPRDRRRQAEAGGLDLGTDDRLRAYWQRISREDPEARRAYVNHFNETYGKWITGKNTVIKINDVIYTHGGISEAFSKWPLREINTVVRAELDVFRGMMKNPRPTAKAFKPRIVYSDDSPLWFRGLATKNDAAAEAEIDRVLANLGARAIVVGHNYSQPFNGASPIVSLANVSRFQGRVFIIDTGIAEAYGGMPTALIYERGEFSLWGETEEVAARRASQVVVPSEPASSKALEEYLRTAVAKAHPSTAAGRTEPWRVTLEKDGVTRRAIFKYIDRRRPHPLPDSYHYELAAYALSRHLGLSFVPPVVKREIEGLPGSLQAFVENAVTEYEMKERKLIPGDPEVFERDRENLRLFEMLVHDKCDNDQDVFIRREDQAVLRVDFSQAFEPRKSLPSGCEIRKCSRKLYEKLLNWDEKKVAGLLSPYLSGEEIEALHSRRGVIVRIIEKLIQIRGEVNVLI